MSTDAIGFLAAAMQIGGTAYLGCLLGDAIRERDDRKREQREAIETVIAESDAYRAEARRKLWAA